MPILNPKEEYRGSALPPTQTFELGPHVSRFPQQSETHHPQKNVKKCIKNNIRYYKHIILKLPPPAQQIRNQI
jgi:hypothetical protein